MTEDGKTDSFIDKILDGLKKGETREHNKLKRGWVGLAKDGKVYGRVKLGAPKWITKASPEYADAMIAGTDYDINGEGKWYYPIEDMEDFRSVPRDAADEVRKMGDGQNDKVSLRYPTKGGFYDGRTKEISFGEGLASEGTQRAIAEIIDGRREASSIRRADSEVGWEPSRGGGAGV